MDTTMVMGNYVKQNEINLTTSTSNNIVNSVIKEELIYSSDEDAIAQLLPSNYFTDGNEGKEQINDTKMVINSSVDNNITSTVMCHNNGDNSILNNKNSNTVLSLLNDDNIVSDNEVNDIELLKSKLHRVLKRKEQYRRRVESLTNGIIALRGTKLILEKKINNVKLSWNKKCNEDIDMENRPVKYG